MWKGDWEWGEPNRLGLWRWSDGLEFCGEGPPISDMKAHAFSITSPQMRERAQDEGRKQAKKMFLDGEARHKASDFEKAFRLFTAALQLLGSCHISSGRTCARILTSRSLARLSLLESSLLPSEGTPELALRDAEEAAAADSSCAEASLRQAEALKVLGRNTEAALCLDIYQQLRAAEELRAAEAARAKAEKEKQLARAKVEEWERFIRKCCDMGSDDEQRNVATLVEWQLLNYKVDPNALFGGGSENALLYAIASTTSCSASVCKALLDDSRVDPQLVRTADGLDAAALCEKCHQQAQAEAAAGKLKPFQKALRMRAISTQKEKLQHLQKWKRKREKAASDKRKLAEKQRKMAEQQLRKARERYFNVCKRGKLPAIQEALSDLAEAGGHGKSHAAPDGRTALHVAVFARQLKAAVFLLRDSEFGCVDPSVADQNGVTPLHLAAEQGQLPIVQALLGHGAVVGKSCGSKHGTPLHAACASGKLDVAKELLVATLQHSAVGAETTWGNDKGDTPLHLACRHGCAAKVAFRSIAQLFLDNERLAFLASAKNAAGEVPNLDSLGIAEPRSSVIDAAAAKPGPAVAAPAQPIVAAVAAKKKPAAATWASLSSVELPPLEECLRMFKQEHAGGLKATDWHAELKNAGDDDDEDEDIAPAAAAQTDGGGAAEVKDARRCDGGGEPTASGEEATDDVVGGDARAIAQEFEGLTWEVECTEHVLKWFKKKSKKGRLLCDQVIHSAQPRVRATARTAR